MLKVSSEIFQDEWHGIWNFLVNIHLQKESAYVPTRNQIRHWTEGKSMKIHQVSMQFSIYISYEVYLLLRGLFEERFCRA